MLRSAFSDALATADSRAELLTSILSKLAWVERKRWDFTRKWTSRCMIIIDLELCKAPEGDVVCEQIQNLQV